MIYGKNINRVHYILTAAFAKTDTEKITPINHPMTDKQIQKSTVFRAMSTS